MQVLRWLDQVSGFGSEDEYLKWLQDRPTSELPRVKMVRAAEEAVRGAMRGAPPEVTEQAIRAAERSVIFLTELVFQVNALVDDQCKVLGLQDALQARTLQLVILGEAAEDHSVAAAIPDSARRLSEVRAEVEWLIGQTHLLREMAEAISRRYFGGRSIVFPQKSARLTAALETAQALACEYNRLVDGRPRRVRKEAPEGRNAKGPPVEPTSIDMEGAQARAVTAAAEETRFCVYLAKAEALAHTGGMDEAVRLLKVHAPGKARRSGPAG